MSDEQKSGIGVFEKYLTVWVLLCMGAGILIGKYVPAIPEYFGGMEIAGINLPIAVLIWIMIFPMMMKVDFQSVLNVRKHPKAIAISTGNAWGIKPFMMFGLAVLFFYYVFRSLIPTDIAQDFITGAVLLGAAPCTAMVFVWSALVKGNPAYTLVQVSINDLLILVLFVPIVYLLLGINDVFVPWDTLAFSIVLFVVIPLVAGMITRVVVINKKGKEYFEKGFAPKFDGVTSVGLLLTLVLIFSFQGGVILEQPLYVVLIAVPLILQNIISWSLTYSLCYKTKQPHNIAGPVSLIAASDFFELAVAVAIALFGPASPVVLVCTVGVLTEVPVMLLLVKIVNKTKDKFPNGDGPGAEKTTV